jgi:photosystem II stability/assembly factor-like uncharacterized protein
MRALAAGAVVLSVAALLAAGCDGDTSTPAPSTVLAPAKWVPQFCSACSNPYYEAVQFLDRKLGWLVGGGGLATTTDGGSTWVRRDLPPNVATLVDVQFVTPSRGWAVGQARGSNGLILTSADGGLTWQQQFIDPQINSIISHVSFSTPYHGIVLGATGVRYTIDGGVTWRRSTGLWHGHDVSMPDPTHAWVATDNGEIFASSDSGATWQKQNTAFSGTSIILDGIDFVDADYGWAVGWEGTILRTFDGGDTWFTMNSGSSEFLSSVSFSDRRHGVVTGSRGTALVTSDGGYSWTREATGTGFGLSSVSSVDPTHAWAVGPGWTIRARTTVPLGFVALGDLLLRPDRWVVVLRSLWFDLLHPPMPWSCLALDC